MTKKPNDDLTQRERVLNKWTGPRRRLQEERYRERRSEDPDEDMIYNVLCPQIRASWSPYVEYEHTVVKNQSVELTPIPDSVLLGT